MTIFSLKNRMVGFIETYSDPLGNRGEWEAFVMLTSKELSKRMLELVYEAPTSYKSCHVPENTKGMLFRGQISLI